MKSGYFIALGVAVVLLLASRTEKGQEVIGNTVDTIANAVRGIRNKNPGNIRRDGTAWAGLSAVQTDPAYCQFDSMAYGVRAMVRVLTTYREKYGLRSVASIIGRWAPPSENATDSYIAAVSDRLGVMPNEAINTRDPDVMFELLRGIIRHENGAAAALLVSDADVRDGIALA